MIENRGTQEAVTSGLAQSGPAPVAPFGRTRQVYGSIAILGALAIVALPFHVYLVSKYQTWQTLVLLVSNILMGAGVLLSLWFVRRNRLQGAAYAMFAGAGIMVICISICSTGTGLWAGVGYLIAVMVISTQTLNPRQANWAIMAGILVGLAAGLIDLIGLPTQAVIPEYNRYVPVAQGVVSLAYLILLAFQFRSLSLSAKLIISFMLVAFTVAGVLALITQRSTRQSLTASVGQGISNLAHSEAVIVGDVINRQISILNTLSLSSLLINQIKAANTTNYTMYPEAIPAELVRLDQQWRAAVAADDNQDPLVQSRLFNSASSELRKFNSVFPGNVESFITDIHGGLVATTNRTSDYAQADEGWWQAAYNEGKGGIYVGAPEYDESAGVYAINVALPVRDVTGPILGILRTTYQISAIQSLLETSRLGQTGEVDLYIPGAPPQRFHEGGLEETDADNLSRLEALAGMPYAEIEYEGSPSLVSVAQVVSSDADPEIARLGWFMTSHQAADEALAPVQAQVRFSLLISVIIIGIASVAGILLAQFIAAPIVSLTQTAEKVRLGDLNARATVQSQDEVGELALTFNQMTERLRQILGGLEATIQERTRELTVAGDVGRYLSQERDLDRLLKSAVDNISSAFGLYYAQLYLLDPGERTLALRAGSGEVGAELLRRGHRLPAAPGSINGLAAAEKRAVIVSDTAASPTFRANPLLPDTRSEMAVPLLVGERVVGVLDIQSTTPGALTEESLPVYRALAGQLAIAIDNATLLQQAEQVRLESEAQARRLTREGWENFLDGIQHSEYIAFAYEGATQSVHSLESEGMTAPGMTFSPETGVPAGQVAAQHIQAPIQVIGEPIGAMRLERGPDQPWTDQEVDLVQAVSERVGRQIENLRLLAQAEQYRLEAEQAVKRQTRAGWDEYLAEQGYRDAPMGYVYDRIQVRHETEVVSGSYNLPLVIAGEQIGEVVLEDVGELEEGKEQLIQEVIDRLSTHLETLRLADQTRLALKTTEDLYAGSEGVVRSATIDDVLHSIATATALRRFDHGNILLFNAPWQDHMPDEGLLVGVWERDGAPPRVPVGTRYNMWEQPFAPMMRQGEPIYLADTRALPDFAGGGPAPEASGAGDLSQFDFHLTQLGRSIAIFPLIVADQWIGWLAMMADEPVPLTEADLRQVQSLTGQAAAVVQGIRLLEESQTRAHREQTLRQFTQRVRSAIDPEQVLRTAAREVGMALGRNVLIRLGSEAQDDGEKERT